MNNYMYLVLVPLGMILASFLWLEISHYFDSKIEQSMKESREAEILRSLKAFKIKKQ